MKTLAHYVPDKDYIAILNSLLRLNNLIISNIHNQLFDFVHVNGVDNIILPIHEYSQEFHYFVEQNFKTKNIFLYFGRGDHEDLNKYCRDNNIHSIKQSEVSLSSPYVTYNRIYDNTVFEEITVERNNKILVILSQDNEKNKQFLDNQLYPNSKLPICLINNPDFEHEQNIGVAYQTDLAILLNSFDSLIDMDNVFSLEAQACGIKNLQIFSNVIETVETKQIKESVTDLVSYASDTFIKDKLLPLMKGE